VLIDGFLAQRRSLVAGLDLGRVVLQLRAHDFVDNRPSSHNGGTPCQ
jgi:hypothetical protein